MTDDGSRSMDRMSTVCRLLRLCYEKYWTPFSLSFEYQLIQIVIVVHSRYMEWHHEMLKYLQHQREHYPRQESLCVYQILCCWNWKCNINSIMERTLFSVMILPSLLQAERRLLNDEIVASWFPCIQKFKDRKDDETFCRLIFRHSLNALRDTIFRDRISIISLVVGKGFQTITRTFQMASEFINKRDHCCWILDENPELRLRHSLHDLEYLLNGVRTFFTIWFRNESINDIVADAPEIITWPMELHGLHMISWDLESINQTSDGMNPLANAYRALKIACKGLSNAMEGMTGSDCDSIMSTLSIHPPCNNQYVLHTQNEDIDLRMQAVRIVYQVISIRRHHETLTKLSPSQLILSEWCDIAVHLPLVASVYLEAKQQSCTKECDKMFLMICERQYERLQEALQLKHNQHTVAVNIEVNGGQVTSVTYRPPVLNHYSMDSNVCLERLKHGMITRGYLPLFKSLHDVVDASPKEALILVVQDRVIQCFQSIVTLTEQGIEMLDHSIFMIELLANHYYSCAQVLRGLTADARMLQVIRQWVYGMNTLCRRYQCIHDGLEDEVLHDADENTSLHYTRQEPSTGHHQFLANQVELCSLLWMKVGFDSKILLVTHGLCEGSDVQYTYYPSDLPMVWEHIGQQLMIARNLDMKGLTNIEESLFWLNHAMTLIAMFYETVQIMPNSDRIYTRYYKYDVSICLALCGQCDGEGQFPTAIFRQIYEHIVSYICSDDTQDVMILVVVHKIYVLYKRLVANTLSGIAKLLVEKM